MLHVFLWLMMISLKMKNIISNFSSDCEMVPHLWQGTPGWGWHLNGQWQHLQPPPSDWHSSDLTCFSVRQRSWEFLFEKKTPAHIAYKQSLQKQSLQRATVSHQPAEHVLSLNRSPARWWRCTCRCPHHWHRGWRCVPLHRCPMIPWGGQERCI